MPIARSKLAWCLALAFFVYAMSPIQAFATPLNLTSTHPGDVTTHFTNVIYHANTGVLTAIGTPDEFDVNSQGFNTSVFSLSMTVNPATGALLSGTVSINGDTDGTPSYSGPLLQGNITQFGFHNAPLSTLAAGNLFEFVVHVTSGALLAPYYSSQTAGIILNIANQASSPFLGVFTSDFHNNGFSGFSDTFPMANPNVPEPSTFVLLSLGIVWLAGNRLRRTARMAR